MTTKTFIIPPAPTPAAPKVNLQAHLIARYPTKMRGYGGSKLTGIQWGYKPRFRLVW